MDERKSTSKWTLIIAHRSTWYITFQAKSDVPTNIWLLFSTVKIYISLSLVPNRLHAKFGNDFDTNECQMEKIPVKRHAIVHFEWRIAHAKKTWIHSKNVGKLIDLMIQPGQSFKMEKRVKLKTVSFQRFICYSER